MLQTTTICCKWSKVRLGPSFVGCPPGPQGTVLGPLLFSLYINDISSDIESEIRLFADDCVFQAVKDEAYKGLVPPILVYGSLVWDPPGLVIQEELESVQKRAARFLTGNYKGAECQYDWHSWTVKMGILKKRRKDNRLILLYKGKASIPTDDFIPKT